jgi:hypothetical protein
MTALSRPAVLAILLAAAALVVHPDLGSQSWLPWRETVVAALLLLCVAGLVARALAVPRGGRVAAWLTAAGLVAVVTAIALDGVRGTQGTLTLELGRARNHFDETSPSGRSLGLRPLGFTLGFERVGATGAVVLEAAGRTGTLEVAADRAVEVGGLRLSQPRLRATGGVARLRVAMSDGQRTEVADLAPGQPVQAGGLLLTLGEYYPDFALDERQQPFTRSLEPRNPAALIDVMKDGARHRAFVMRSMPGVHRVEPLGVSFSMLDLEPEQAVELSVHRQPFAPLALAGGVLLALGLAAGAWSAARGAVEQKGADAILLAGGLLAVALLLADRGRVLSWEFAVGDTGGRTPLPGVGPLLGITLLAAALGTLLRAAARFGSAAAALVASRAVLWAAVAAGACGVALAAVRVSLLPVTTRQQVLEVAGVAAAVALLAFVLARTARGRDEADALSRAIPLLAVAITLAATAAARVGLQEQGTYASGAAAAAAAAVLLGLSALETTRLAALRRLAFLLAALAPLL